MESLPSIESRLSATAFSTPWISPLSTWSAVMIYNSCTKLSNTKGNLRNGLSYSTWSTRRRPKHVRLRSGSQQAFPPGSSFQPNRAKGRLTFVVMRNSWKLITLRVDGFSSKLAPLQLYQLFQITLWMLIRLLLTCLFLTRRFLMHRTIHPAGTFALFWCLLTASMGVLFLLVFVIELLLDFASPFTTFVTFFSKMVFIIDV